MGPVNTIARAASVTVIGSVVIQAVGDLPGPQAQSGEHFSSSQDLKRFVNYQTVSVVVPHLVQVPSH